MDSRVSTADRLVWGIALRALSIAGLAYLVIHLTITTRLYATTSIALGLLLLVGTDIVRAIKCSALRTSYQAADPSAPLGARQTEYLQTLLDTVAAALIVVAPDGEVRFVNRAAHSLFQGSTCHLRDIAELDDAAVQMLLALAPGARQIIQLTNGHHVLCMAARFSTPGRAPERLISLQRIAGELDAVEVKAWQDIARVIAHEMMNSLTPIASLSESLEGLLREHSQNSNTGPISDDIAQSLEAIKRRSLGLMNFIERYRSVAELPPPVIDRVEAARLIADIETLMNAELKERRVILSTRIDPPDLAFPADSELLEQAVINLLRNAAEAAEHTPDARARLECALESGQIFITVADNGSGLPQNEPERILLPFYSSKPGGSGIGLALVRHIALAHQGRLEVRANEPRGAVVSIVLPMARLGAGPISPVINSSTLSNEVRV